MQPDEVVVARLGKGASLVRYLETTGDRVSVALGRNRQARLPPDRILLATGVMASDPEELEELSRRCQDLSSDIDLSEVWEVITDEATPIDLDGLAELYWGPSPTVTQRVALVLYLDQSTDYFEHGLEGYTARSRASVQEIQARRRREAENAEAAQSLVDGLSRGRLPQPLTQHQATLLKQLRDYAVHGDDYARAAAARSLLGRLPVGAGDPQRRSFDLLVSAGVFSPDEPLELHRAGIPVQFPEDALAEAAALDAPSEHLMEPGRKDLTALPAVTIDDADTEERDDALSLEIDEAGADVESTGYRIGIHIADAGALIPHGGAIDREADRRMATLYLPERTIGMLPPGFSRRLGSLDPQETRPAMSLLVQVSASGEASDWEITPSVIRCRASLTYEEVDRALEDENSPWHQMLTGLGQAAQALRRRREADGAVNIDQPEMAIKAHPSGEVEVRVLQRSSPARQLVSELMILCNSLLAEYCRSEGLPAVYRSQAAPDLSDLAVDPRSSAEGPGLSEAQRALQRYRIVRRLLPAELDTNPAPHGGLGVPAYIQASSPLRRYPDLVMQRQIGHFLSSGRPLYPTQAVSSVVYRAEVQLRELARLEDRRKRYWFLKYLQQSRLKGPGPGDGSELFAASVLENEPRRRALLELAEFPFRVRAELPHTLEPGDTVTLKLQGVDLWRRIGHFVLAPDT
jgi:exoribonuclease-2